LVAFFAPESTGVLRTERGWGIKETALLEKIDANIAGATADYANLCKNVYAAGLESLCYMAVILGAGVFVAPALFSLFRTSCRFGDEFRTREIAN